MLFSFVLICSFRQLFFLPLLLHFPLKLFLSTHSPSALFRFLLLSTKKQYLFPGCPTPADCLNEIGLLAFHFYVLYLFFLFLLFALLLSFFPSLSFAFLCRASQRWQSIWINDKSSQLEFIISSVAFNLINGQNIKVQYKRKLVTLNGARGDELTLFSSFWPVFWKCPLTVPNCDANTAFTTDCCFVLQIEQQQWLCTVYSVTLCCLRVWSCSTLCFAAPPFSFTSSFQLSILFFSHFPYRIAFGQWPTWTTFTSVAMAVELAWWFCSSGRPPLSSHWRPSSAGVTLTFRCASPNDSALSRKMLPTKFLQPVPASTFHWLSFSSFTGASTR